MTAARNGREGAVQVCRSSKPPGGLRQRQFILEVWAEMIPS